MTKCVLPSTPLPAFKGRKVEVNFEGGDITSDGGIILLQQMDRKLGLTEKIAGRLCDPRDPSRVKHDQLSMVRQRLYGLALGYEDLNDHSALRRDSAFQTAPPFIKRMILPVVPRCADLKTELTELSLLLSMKFL